MSWDNQQPPWGQQKPATPEEMLAAFLRKIKQTLNGGGNGGDNKNGAAGGKEGGLRLIILAALIGVGLIMANSAYYTIQPGERGVVLRFGKYLETTTSGLNFKVPMVDKVVKVDVESVRKEEFGFRTRTPGQQTAYQKKGYDAESLMLTGDKNVIDAEWIVQYNVRDPYNFLFKVSDVGQSVRDISEAAIRHTVGNMDFDYVLSNRELLAGATARALQDTLDSYQSGVKILTVQLQDVNPPERVKPAFNEVNEADQDMKRLVNEAEEAYNRVIPRARGQAKEMVETAHGYAVERVNKGKGDTVRFLSVLKEYKMAEDVTRRRLYLETMRDVLPTITEIYVMEEGQRSVLPFLDVRGGRGTTVPTKSN
jgi:modulator of FtsH protease HflK